MNTLIKNAIVVPVSEEGWWDPGYILIEGTVIKAAGPGLYEGPKEGIDRIIDAKGKLVMPGLINTHGHAAMTLLRSYADDLPLMEWLQNRIWPVEDRMTGEDIHWGTHLAIIEMIRSGTTTFTDMYFHMDQVAQAVNDSGIRAVLSRGMIGFGEKGPVAIQQSRDFIQQWNGKAEGRITTLLGPHAPYTCPPPYLEQVIALSEELNQGLQIHLSETRSEVETSFREHGMSPIALMEKIGLFNRPVLAAHCVHVSQEDMDILAAHQVHVAHNPDSNLKLGSGVAPLVQMLQKGIVVGLGTDGAASNNNLDMFEEMRMAAMLHKGVQEDAVSIPAFQALQMATVEGAKALFLQGLGTITAGSLADLIFLDWNRPYYMPRHNVIAHLVYAGQSGDVTDVMVHGKMVLEDRAMVTIDEEKVYYEVNQAVNRLFAT